jgi:hypothetical protein
MFENIQITIIIKLFILAIGVGLGIYLGRFAKAFLLWIKGGIQDGDNVLQNKELQIAWFSLLSAFIVVSIAIFSIDYPDAIIYCTFGAATGMYLGRQFSLNKKNDKNDDKKEGEF